MSGERTCPGPCRPTDVTKDSRQRTPRDGPAQCRCHHRRGPHGGPDRAVRSSSIYKLDGASSSGAGIQRLIILDPANARPRPVAHGGRGPRDQRLRRRPMLDPRCRGRNGGRHQPRGHQRHRHHFGVNPGGHNNIPNSGFELTALADPRPRLWKWPTNSTGPPRSRRSTSTPRALVFLKLTTRTDLMPTRRFDVNKEQSVAYYSGSSTPTGATAMTPTARIGGVVPRHHLREPGSLWRFAHDWSGMTQVTKIELHARLTATETHTQQGSSQSVRMVHVSRPRSISVAVPRTRGHGASAGPRAGVAPRPPVRPIDYTLHSVGRG